MQQQSARFRHWPNKSIHMKVSVRDKASTPQTAFCPGWSNKSARWEYRLTCLQLQAGPGSSRGLKRCQKNGCGSGSGKHQQRDGAGFMLTNGVTRHKGWVREGKEPPDSGHPKQRRELCAHPWPGCIQCQECSLDKITFGTCFRHRLYRHTDTFFVDIGISLLPASANSFPDSTPHCCTPSMQLLITRQKPEYKVVITTVSLSKIPVLQSKKFVRS